MIFNMVGGGGGSPLNFKVVAGLERPANPKENTLWVKTDTAISGYTLDSEAPTLPVPDGHLWIATTYSSRLRIQLTKKDPVYVYPNAANQYIGGSWMPADAEIFQDGSWAPLIVYLYNAGDDCAGLTGGWEATKSTRGDPHYATVNAELAPQADCLRIIAPAKCHAVVHTIRQVDLSGVKTLRYHLRGRNPSTDASWIQIGVWTTIGSHLDDYRLAVANTSTGQFDGFYELDVAAINQPVLVGVSIFAPSEEERIEIVKIEAKG